MTDARKLKAKIRARAERTGESYAAARRHVVAQLDAERQARTEATADKARKSSATGAVSDERCREKTGHGFDHWFGVLDRFGARREGHTAAARHLREEHGVSAWYCQAITVAYERAHGLREVGQLSSGKYQTSATRVLPASLESAARVLEGEPGSVHWLAELGTEEAESLRSAIEDPGLKVSEGRRRLRYRLRKTVIELDLRSRPDGRSGIALRHTNLPDRDSLETHKAAWRAILDRLRELLREQS